MVDIRRERDGLRPFEIQDRTYNERIRDLADIRG
jgi:hypothetical protein